MATELPSVALLPYAPADCTKEGPTGAAAAGASTSTTVVNGARIIAPTAMASALPRPECPGLATVTTLQARKAVDRARERRYFDHRGTACGVGVGVTRYGTSEVGCSRVKDP